MTRVQKILGAALAVLFLGCGVPTGSDADKPMKTTSGNGIEDATSAPSAPAYTPVPADFQLEVIELEKNCYGSAGCNVTYMVDPTYVGQPLDPSQSYTVIYSLTGGDATETGSFTVQGTQYEKPGEDMISTSSSGAVLRATVTRVVAD